MLETSNTPIISAVLSGSGARDVGSKSSEDQNASAFRQVLGSTNPAKAATAETEQSRRINEQIAKLTGEHEIKNSLINLSLNLMRESAQLISQISDGRFS